MSTGYREERNESNERVYGEFASGDYVGRTEQLKGQNKVPQDCTVLYIIGYLDSTLCGNFGKASSKPMSVTLGNFKRNDISTDKCKEVVAYFPEMKSSDKQLSDDAGYVEARRQVYHDAWRTVLAPLIKIQEEGGFVFKGKTYYPVWSLINNDHPEGMLLNLVKNSGWPCRTC